MRTAMMRTEYEVRSTDTWTTRTVWKPSSMRQSGDLYGSSQPPRRHGLLQPLTTGRLGGSDRNGRFWASSGVFRASSRHSARQSTGIHPGVQSAPVPVFPLGDNLGKTAGNPFFSKFPNSLTTGNCQDGVPRYEVRSTCTLSTSPALVRRGNRRVGSSFLLSLPPTRLTT